MVAERGFWFSELYCSSIFSFREFLEIFGFIWLFQRFSKCWNIVWHVVSLPALRVLAVVRTLAAQ